LISRFGFGGGSFGTVIASIRRIVHRSPIEQLMPDTVSLFLAEILFR
jgi:hypothetical protein